LNTHSKIWVCLTDTHTQTLGCVHIQSCAYESVCTDKPIQAAVFLMCREVKLGYFKIKAAL